MSAPAPDRRPHEARDLAESFGAEADRYARARPAYPNELVRLVARRAPGPTVVDVGCGTGILARQLAALGCDVLGVEIDKRMAARAREAGLTVEVSAFERWDPAGRAFDAIVSGQAWHWVDPAAGAAVAARALVDGGELALLWNVMEIPTGLADAFAAVYERTAPSWPPFRPGLDAYERVFAAAEAGIAGSGAFTAPERHRVDWSRPYTRAQWLDLVPTFGRAAELSPAALAALLEGIGAAVDAVGGRFAMGYASVAVLARRTPA